MRILHISGGVATIGGMELITQRICEFLSIQGHVCALVTSGPPDETVGFQVISIDGRFDTASDPSAAEAEDAVLRAAREFQPDVILTHTIANGRLLSRLNEVYPTAEFLHVYLCVGSKLFRQTNEICTHPMGPRCLFDWYVLACGNSKAPSSAWSSYRRSLAHRDALKQLPAVLVASDFMRKYLIGEGLSPDRVHVSDCVMGIPPEKNAREDTSEQRRHTLLFVGRVTYSKGVQLAIEALTRLEAEYRLVVVGDGWYMPELRRQVDRLRLADRIEFTGFLRGDALERRYAESDILVVPSIWPEPAGLVVPEARGRGLKVAAFATGGLPEWAGRYGYGDIYLAQSVTAAALAAAIRSAKEGAAPSVPQVTTPRRNMVELLQTAIDAWRS